MARWCRRRGCHHDFSDEINDSRGWLFGFKFSKNVALVIGFAGLLTSNKSKATTVRIQLQLLNTITKFWFHYLNLLWTDWQSRFLATLVPASILRIQSTIGNGQHGIMSPDIKKTKNKRYFLNNDIKFNCSNPLIPEKEFPLIVGESDSLRRDFKMNNSRYG